MTSSKPASWLVSIGLLLAALATSCEAQTESVPAIVSYVEATTPARPVIFGFVGHPALDSLEKWWKDGDVNEQGYCVTSYWKTKYPDPTIGDSTVRVWRVERAVDEVDADRQGVAFSCPAGAATIHTHPHHRGDSSNCTPSRLDRETAAKDNEPFSVVQCERDAFYFYYRNGA